MMNKNKTKLFLLAFNEYNDFRFGCASKMKEKMIWHLDVDWVHGSFSKA